MLPFNDNASYPVIERYFVAITCVMVVATSAWKKGNADICPFRKSGRNLPLPNGTWRQMRIHSTHVWRSSAFLELVAAPWNSCAEIVPAQLLPTLTPADAFSSLHLLPLLHFSVSFLPSPISTHTHKQFRLVPTPPLLRKAVFSRCVVIWWLIFKAHPRKCLEIHNRLTSTVCG